MFAPIIEKLECPDVRSYLFSRAKEAMPRVMRESLSKTGVLTVPGLKH